MASRVLCLVALVAVATAQYAELPPFNYAQLQALGDHSDTYRPFGWMPNGEDSVVKPPGMEEQPPAAFASSQPAYPFPQFVEASSQQMAAPMMQMPQQPYVAQLDQVQQAPQPVLAAAAPAVPQKPGFLEEVAVTERVEEPMIGKSPDAPSAELLADAPGAESAEAPQADDAQGDPEAPTSDPAAEEPFDDPEAPQEPNPEEPAQDGPSEGEMPPTDGQDNPIVDPDSPESMGDASVFGGNQTDDDLNNTSSDALPLEPLTQPNEMRLQEVSAGKPLVQIGVTQGAIASPAASIAPPQGPLAPAGAPFPSNGEVKRCVPNGAGGCVVRFDPNALQWRTRIVAPGSIAPVAQPGAAGPSLTMPQLPALDLNGPLPNVQLNDDPAIRAAEKDYLRKRERLNREQAWVTQVKALIREYQEKVRKASSDVSSLKVQLSQSRRNILTAVRAKKAAALHVQLTAAMGALQKLNSHSVTMKSRVQELKNRKLGMQKTIQAIRRVIGSVPSATEAQLGVNLPRFRELLPTPQQLQKQAEIHSSVQGFMSALLEVLERHHQKLHAEETQMVRQHQLTRPAPIKRTSEVLRELRKQTQELAHTDFAKLENIKALYE